MIGYNYECCKNCNNNPINNPFSNGICSCVLPYMEMFRIGGPVKTSTSTEVHYNNDINNTVSTYMYRKV